MGQKIHPKCFRLGTTQNHLSLWFTNKNSYSHLLFQDCGIRDTLRKIFQEKQLSISDIEIKRIHENEIIFISILTPNVNKFFKLKSQDIENFLGKKFPNLKKIFLILKKIDDKAKDANLVTDQIVKKLENRYSFKRAMKEAIRQSQASGIEGIKVQISGRLNGAEIARSQWRREGRVPLHTLRAKIGYSYQTASTIYGILGVKVWLFLGEVTNIENTLLENV